jgi:hypothetical protein
MQSNGTDMRDVYIADVDMTRGSIGDGSRMSVPVDTSVDDTYDSITNSDSVALQLSRDNEALKTELRTVRMELSETAEQVQHLTVQLADKERSLQVAKADMIETRLELQRNQTELQVCVPGVVGGAWEPLRFRSDSWHHPDVHEICS